MKVIGWIGYFKAKKGNEKSVWMSIADIEDHAQRHVKEYDKNQNWKDPEKRRTMEMKTVLRKLLAWADLSGLENAKLAEALINDPDYEPVEAQAEDVTDGRVTEPAGEEAEAAEWEPETPPAPVAVEMIDPLGKQAVGYAAHQWNINEIDARKAIFKETDGGKLTNPMPKADFKAWVKKPNGEPEPA
jgi:recombinational DNA repair protein RecT